MRRYTSRWTALLVVWVLVFVACAGSGGPPVGGPTSGGTSFDATQVLQRAMASLPAGATFTISMVATGIPVAADAQQDLNLKSLPAARLTGDGAVAIPHSPEIGTLSYTLASADTSEGQVSITQTPQGTFGTLETGSIKGIGWVQLGPSEGHPGDELFNYASLQNVKAVDQPQMDGHDTYHISGMAVANAPGLTQDAPVLSHLATEDVWIDRATYMPVQQVVSASDPSTQETETLTITFTSTSTDASSVAGKIIPAPSSPFVPSLDAAPVSQAVPTAAFLSTAPMLGSVRELGAHDTSSVLAPAGCTTPNHHWWSWGTLHVFLNHCTIADLASVLSTLGSLARFVLAVCGPAAAACGVAAGILAGFLAIFSGLLTRADIRCGSHGAILNWIPWLGVVVWVSALC
jgi:hypothetical protein